MDPGHRIVTQLPLLDVWDSEGTVSCERMHFLSSEDIRSLLQRGRVRFVVANVGQPLNWISIDGCFEYWKSEGKPHLAAPNADRYSLDDSSGGYFYIASRWASAQEPIVLLEMHH